MRGQFHALQNWGQFLTSPPVAKFDPQGFSWPVGVKFLTSGEVIPQGKNIRVFTPGSERRGEQSS
jgi:hypothetical protein